MLEFESYYVLLIHHLEAPCGHLQDVLWLKFKSFSFKFPKIFIFIMHTTVRGVIFLIHFCNVDKIEIKICNQSVKNSLLNDCCQHNL